MKREKYVNKRVLYNLQKLPSKPLRISQSRLYKGDFELLWAERVENTIADQNCF